MCLPVLPGLPVSKGSPVRDEGVPGLLLIPAAMNEKGCLLKPLPSPSGMVQAWVAPKLL